MTKKIKFPVSALCLIILVLLLALTFVQQMNWLDINNLGVMLVYALIFAVPMILYSKCQKKALPPIRKTPVSLRQLPGILVISLAVCLISSVINLLCYMPFASSLGAQPTAMFDYTTQNPLVVFLNMVALPAVTEEMLLRGLALSYYERQGTLRAIVLTALIFALFHGNPVHLPALFVAGVAYGFLSVLYDSVYPALIAHLFNNAAALLVYYNHEYFSYILSDALFLIFALILIFVVLIWTFKILEKTLGIQEKKQRLYYLPKDEDQNPYHDICLLLFALGCIGKMIWSYLV